MQKLIFKQGFLPDNKLLSHTIGREISMACPICFFRDSYQRKLKVKTFGTKRFEDKLILYKTIYLGEIQKLKSLSGCSCYKKYNHKLLVTWLDEFLLDLKSSQVRI